MIRDKQEWLRSYLGAPIIIRGRLVGVLNVDSSMPNFFAQDRPTNWRLRRAGAIALQNAQLMGETSRRAEQLTTSTASV